MIEENTRWSHLNKQQMKALIDLLTQTKLTMKGKTTNKEEFVTAGGVKLEEVNFKTMESKLIRDYFSLAKC